MTAPSFDDFALDPRLLAAVQQLGFTTPTPIQAEAIPVLLSGRDVVGRARTGSGKTAAFGLPLLEAVKDGARAVGALVLAPTRELALQVSGALRDLSQGLPIEVLTVYGGTPYDAQLRGLRKGVQVVVGTPGRVLDHLRRGTLDLGSVRMFVLDEADEMLRMGFIDDVEEIVAATPASRQVALFSATMPAAIRRLAESHFPDPVEVQVESRALSVGHIEQLWIRVPERFKLDALVRVLRAEPRGTALVFTHTRARCAEVADALARRGVPADALHGDLNQAARERVLNRLRAGALDVVVATDVASRGIDVQHITHVINVDVPRGAESYVHRIGRTARAGAKGVAISLVTPKQKRRMRELQAKLGVEIKHVEVPSDAAIARTRRRRLVEELKAVLEDTDLTEATRLLAELGDSQAVAAAAVHLLAQERQVPLAEATQDQLPEWARPIDRRDDVPRADLNQVELFLPVGKRSGVRPADLVGALANEAGIPGRRIGRISIFDRKSFVGVEEEVAQRVLSSHPTLQIRGEEVPLSLARPRPPGDSPPSGPRDRGRHQRAAPDGQDRRRKGAKHTPWRPRKGQRR